MKRTVWTQDSLRKLIPIGVSLLLGGAWAFTIATRLLDFYSQPLLGKVVLLGILSPLCILVASISIRFFEKVIETFAYWPNKFLLITLGAVCLVGVSFIILPYHSQPFHTIHTLEIIATGDKFLDSQNNTVEILAITYDNGYLIPVADMQFSTPSGQQAIFHNASEETLQLQAGDRIRFESEAIMGVRILFRSNPRSGIVYINWDGNTQEIDLYYYTEKIREVNLPGSSWGKPRTAWMLVGFAGAVADFLTLTSLLVFGALLSIPRLLFPESACLWLAQLQSKLEHHLQQPTATIFLAIILLGAGLLTCFSLIQDGVNHWFTASVLGYSFLVLGLAIFLARTKRLPGFVLQLALIVTIISNLFLFDKVPPQQLSENLPELHRNQTNELTALIHTFEPSEEMNVAIAFYPYLKGATLIASPGLLETMVAQPSLLKLYVNLKRLQTASYKSELSADEFLALRQLVNAQWDRLDGGGYLFILEKYQVDIPLVLAKYQDWWLFIPQPMYPSKVTP